MLTHYPEIYGSGKKYIYIHTLSLTGVRSERHFGIGHFDFQQLRHGCMIAQYQMATLAQNTNLHSPMLSAGLDINLNTR